MTIKAAAVCALVMLSTPAAAQGWGRYGPGGYEPVGYPEIRASLRAEGLRPISQPILSGRYVVIRAVDRYGEPVRVLLSARYGDVVDVTRLSSGPVAGLYEPRPSRPYAVYPDRRYPALEPRAARPDLMTEPPESVPNAAPNGRAAAPNAGPRSAALTPNRTPTPRPRPATAGTTAAVTPAPAATETKPAPAATTAAKPAPAPAATAPKPSPAAAAAALSTPDAPAVTGSTPPPDGRHTFPPTTTLE